jgi:hypothetical protein
VLLQASWVAVRNHQHEKLNCLRNAVLNSARQCSVPEDIRLLFIRYVDELTSTHLVILRFFINNESEVAHFDSLEKVYSAFLESVEVQVSRELFKLALEDLRTRLLLWGSQHLIDFPGIYTESALLDEDQSQAPRIRVTTLGRQFFDFVAQAKASPR